MPIASLAQTSAPGLSPFTPHHYRHGPSRVCCFVVHSGKVRVHKSHAPPCQLYSAVDVPGGNESHATPVHFIDELACGHHMPILRLEPGGRQIS